MTTAIITAPRRIASALILIPVMSTAFAKAPDYISPEQTGPGEVVFRYYAPNAQHVSVQGLRRQDLIPMTKSADGMWSVTVTGLVPDLYSYTFDVDGAWVIDPRDRDIKNWLVSESALEVKGDAPADYSIVDVPHGTVSHHFYHSLAGNRELSFYVYTPPGYEADGSTYPLIVLLHGSGDLVEGWQESGRANFIADNLIARGAMKKAVILMPYGHPVPRPPQANLDGTNYSAENNPAMERELLGEVLPFVESHYRVSKDAEQHAIVGLSMGGGHALWIGMGHPELFHWIGAFSFAAPEHDFEPQVAPWVSAARAGDRVHPIYMAIGKSDGHMAKDQKFAAWLKANSVPYTWKEVDGGHEWPLWRAFLSDFAQNVFDTRRRSTD